MTDEKKPALPKSEAEINQQVADLDKSYEALERPIRSRRLRKNPPKSLELEIDVIVCVVGDTVTANITFAHIPVTQPVDWYFSWGDGTNTSGSVTGSSLGPFTHQYSDSGHYTISITLIDQDGFETTDTTIIHVGYEAWGWGYNTSNSMGFQTSPGWDIYARGDNKTWNAISGSSEGAPGSLGIDNNGNLWSWGTNTNGAVLVTAADNTPHPSPVQIGANTWKKVVRSGNGENQSFAIKSDDTLWCWGGNSSGHLGIGNTSTTLALTQVGSSTWSHISSGRLHALGIKTDGSLWAWGSNTAGRLGDGSTSQRTSPVQIGLDTTWTSIAAGEAHSLGIKGGTLWAWGSNGNGQLGQGSTDANTHSSPLQIGSDTDWASVYAPRSSSGGSSFAIKQNGTLWAWGRNDSGQLGLGDTTDRSTPVQVGVSTGWTYVVSYRGSTYGVNAGSLYVWGAVPAGTICYYVDQSLSPSAITLPFTVVTVAPLSNGSISVLDDDGYRWVLGANDFNGALGNGFCIHQATPVEIDTRFVWQQIRHVTSGSSTTYLSNGIATDVTTHESNVVATGPIANFPLTGDTPKTKMTPILDSSMRWIDVSDYIGIAFNPDSGERSLWVWGDSATSLGAPSKNPYNIIGQYSDWISVKSSHRILYALRSNGELWAWGDGYYGGFGNGTTSSVSSPMIIAEDVAQISPASDSSSDAVFIIKNDGYLFGTGYLRYLGSESSSQINTFTQIGSAKWTKIATSKIPALSAGIQQDGTLWTWGNNSNFSGSLGRAASNYSLGQVGAYTDWIDVAVSSYNAAAIRSDNSLWTWGMAGKGALGDGQWATDATTPQSRGGTKWAKVSGGYTSWGSFIAFKKH